MTEEMNKNEKTDDEKNQDKPPLNPLGIIMLVLIMLPATYGLFRLFGVDLGDTLVRMIRKDDAPQPEFIPAALRASSAPMMQRYETKLSVAELAEKYRQAMKKNGYEPIGGRQEPPTDKKWYRLLEKNGEMRLTFLRGSQICNMFAKDLPEGGCVVVKTILPANPKMDAGDIPGVAVPPDSKRYFSIHQNQDDSWMADYHSEKEPLELAEWMRTEMIEKGWVCNEKESEQIKASTTARMLVFENSGRRCMIWIHPGRNGGSDITISNMKLSAK